MGRWIKEGKYKVLLLESIHPVARQRLAEAGFLVEVEAGSLEGKALLERARGFHAIGIRSKSQVSAEVLRHLPELLVVGAFCIGTNQIDLQEANRQGIPVFNAPYSNTRSVAELVICELVALARQLGDRNTSAHSGGWLKSAAGSHEIRGKTLGIIGYGHIGSQVSVLAEAMGLRVCYFDIIKKLPLGNARPTATLEDLLASSDFVTLHVPETPQTQNMIGEQELRRMRRGAFLINASRGTVVDIGSLAAALRENHLAGAAIDVFPIEPANNKEVFSSELQGLPNVILTPHIGGSTEEAQEAIGYEVAESFVRFLRTGATTGTVNFPVADAPPVTASAVRLINIHRNVPGVLGSINSIVSRAGCNIVFQHLGTDPQIGYLVMDLGAGDPDLVIREIAELPTSLLTRQV